MVDGLARRLPFHFSVSMTTRPPRPSEVDGVDYHFVDPERFERAVAEGELMEWAEYAGNLYGTPRGAITELLDAGHDVLLDIELHGARQIKAAHPEALAIFVAPPDLETLRERLEGRGDTSPDDVESRLAIAKEQMDAAPTLFDHIVVNDELSSAIDRVVGILAAPDRSSPS